jgi:hypothetical protein
MRLDPALTYDEIALRGGWVRKKERGRTGEATTVKRAIGVENRTDGGQHYASATCREETALRIAQAIHVDPWEIGL